MGHAARIPTPEVRDSDFGAFEEAKAQEKALQFKVSDGQQWRDPFDRWAHRANAPSLNVSAVDGRIKLFTVDRGMSFTLQLTADEAAALADQLQQAAAFVRSQAAKQVAA